MTNNLLVPTRRGLIKVLSGIIAAPAVIKASSLMPVVAHKTIGVTFDEYLDMLVRERMEALSDAYAEAIIYGTSCTSLPDTSWQGFNKL